MSDDLDFSSIMTQYQPMVHRMLFRLTGSGEHIDDLSQEVFLRLYRGLPHFRGEAQLTTFLYRIVANVVKDEQRRQIREGQVIEPWIEARESMAPADHAITNVHVSAFAATMDKALRLLEEPERLALLLFHQEDLKYREIADIMDIPINSVKTHIFRARQKLQVYLKEHLAR